MCRSLRSLLIAFGAICFVSNSVRADVQLEAFVGQPFGVAQVTIDTAEFTPQPDVRYLELSREGGSVFYSVVSSGDAPLAVEHPRQATKRIVAQFLFKGDEPFVLNGRVRGGADFSVTVTPVVNEVAATKLLKKWWKWYADRATLRSAITGPDNSMNSYLTGMLAQRLKLKSAPSWKSGRNYDLDLFLGLLTGTNSIRAAMQAETFLNDDQRDAKAELALPAGVDIPAVPVPPFPANQAVEPIALHIPEDCFYIRAGSFANFLWLRRNVDWWGTQFRDFMSERPVDLKLQEKLEQQLALRETVVGRLFGEKAISDVALIGADTFLQEGAAIGVVFEAKLSKLLATQIEKLRDESAAEHPEATRQVIEVAGRGISLLSTPDNSVRSFYVIDGDYHLVTNSQAIARDFLRAGQGQAALGKLDEFKHARHLMPGDEQQTAFVYLSDPFFRRLVGPHYRVEMTRRLRALTDLEAVQFGQLAAANEKSPSHSLAELIDGGFLPERFLTRPDQSRTELVDGVPIDSLRGTFGCFVPIPDIEVPGVTASERDEYEKFMQTYRRLWTRVDPVAISVVRTGVGAEREHVSFDFYITPYVQQQFGFLSQFLGQPVAQRMTRHPRDVLGLEAVIGPNLARMGNNAAAPVNYRIFATLRDDSPEFEIKDGFIRYPESNWEGYWYLGSTPPLLVLGDHDGELDADGYFQSDQSVFPFSKNFWGRVFDGIRVRAVSREILDEVTPRLRVVDAERPSQIRFWMNRLRGTRFEPALVAQAYLEARKSSGRVAGLYDRFEEQLGVHSEQCVAVANRVLHGDVACPLGGEFEVSDNGGVSCWTSTAWQTVSANDVRDIPADYQLPLLGWFHGLEVEFSIDATTLRTRFEITLSPDQR